MTKFKNLFATVLTYAAPSSNYRGESEASRTVLQKISRKDGKREKEYTVISPESMRNALREILINYDLPHNRTRLHNEDQLAVEFKEFPDAEKYADDYLFGFLVADKDAVKKYKSKPAKRDSVFRQNLAVALTPYELDATFHQSPKNAGNSPWKNSSNSALLHREVAYTAYQYPFALAYSDCQQKKEWVAQLLSAIGELNGVAGNHARSYFEMAPRSIVARLTPRLVAGYNTYGFKDDGNFTDLSRVNGEDLPGEEFWVGGELVREIKANNKEEFQRLENAGVKLYENPERLLADLSNAFLNQEEA